MQSGQLLTLFTYGTNNTKVLYALPPNCTVTSSAYNWASDIYYGALNDECQVGEDDTFSSLFLVRGRLSNPLAPSFEIKFAIATSGPLPAPFMAASPFGCIVQLYSGSLAYPMLILDPNTRAPTLCQLGNVLTPGPVFVQDATATQVLSLCSFLHTGYPNAPTLYCQSPSNCYAPVTAYADDGLGDFLAAAYLRAPI